MTATKNVLKSRVAAAIQDKNLTKKRKREVSSVQFSQRDVRWK